MTLLVYTSNIVTVKCLTVHVTCRGSIMTEQPDTRNRGVIEYEGTDGSGTAELRGPEDDNTGVVFKTLKENGNPMQERIMGLVADHNAYARSVEGVPTIPEDIIEFATIPTVKMDDEKGPYITDMNNIIRYYHTSGDIEMTEDFLENRKTADSTERDTSLRTIYNTA